MRKPPRQPGPHFQRPASLLFTFLLATTVAGCGVVEHRSTCEGKCDLAERADNFIDLFRHPEQLPDVLRKLSADSLTGMLNSRINDIDGVRPRLERTGLYGLADQAEHNHAIEAIDQLRATAVYSYGENALASRLMEQRKRYLEQHPGTAWAEGRFQLRLAPRLSVSLPGFGGYDSRVRAGLASLDATLSATVIAPYRGTLEGLTQAPATAALNRLGGLPDDLDSYRKLAPGQLVALHSDRGVAGFSINVGAPLHLATIDPAVVFARVSGYAHVTVTSAIDVQIVRDGEDRVVVDVGLTDDGADDAPDQKFQLALNSGWGVKRLDIGELQIGGHRVDLGDIVRDALRDQLNRYLKPVSARLTWHPRLRRRSTLTRLAFALDQQHLSDAQREAVSRAFNLATHGILFQAQHLARHAGSGVTEIFSVDRSRQRSHFYAGVDQPALGLSFFGRDDKNDGRATLTIGPDTQHLFWSQVEGHRGWFLASEAHQATGLGAVDVKGGRVVDTDYNFRVRLTPRYGQATRDELLDHVDALLMALLGPARFSSVASAGDALGRYSSATGSCEFEAIDRSGKEPRFDPDRFKSCLKRHTSDDTVAALEGQARSAVAEAIAGGAVDTMAAPFQRTRDFVDQLLDLKLALAKIPENGLTTYQLGMPGANLRIEYRLTATALARALAAGGEERFAAALSAVVDQTNLDRRFPAGEVCQRTLDVHGKPRDSCSANPIDTSARVKRVARAFAEQAARFRRLDGLALLPLADRDGGKPVRIGESGVVVQIDDRGRLVEKVSEQTLAAASVAERKAALLAQLFERVVDEAEPWMPVLRAFDPGLGKAEAYAVAYALLQLVPPGELELLVHTKIDDAPLRALPELRLYGRGQGAKLIDAGRFPLDPIVAH